jgi:hypothetical protein
MKITAAVTEVQDRRWSSSSSRITSSAAGAPGRRCWPPRRRRAACAPALLRKRRHRTCGPRDIVRWLRNVSIEQLPWREYTVSRAA